MMNRDEVTSSGRHDVDIWHVRLANGETRSLSLDELDAGFHDGWIDAHTPVLPAGAIRWAPLGEVAGLGDDDAYDAPSPVSSVPNSIAPLTFDTTSRDVPFDVDVPSDLGLDPDVLAFRPRRSKTLLRVTIAVAVVAGLGFAGLRGKPALQRALASRGVSAVAAAAGPPPHAAPLAVTPPPQITPASVPAPGAPAAAPDVPSMSLMSLPSAPQTAQEKKAAADAEKKAAAEAKKAKRAATQKRAK